MAEDKAQDKPAGQKNSRSGPNPAHTLLKSIRDALAAGVEPAKIVPLLDMANSAVSVTQAPVWRSCAKALDEYAKQVQQAPATPQA